MKTEFQVKQPEVFSNLEYLIRFGFVCIVNLKQTKTTNTGRKIHSRQVGYQISSKGIKYLTKHDAIHVNRFPKEVSILDCQEKPNKDRSEVNAKATGYSHAVKQMQVQPTRKSLLPKEFVRGGKFELKSRHIIKTRDRPTLLTMGGAWKCLKGLRFCCYVVETLARFKEGILNLLKPD